MSFAAIHAVRNSTLSPAPNAAMSAPPFRPGTHADTVFGRLRRLSLDEVHDRPRVHSELRVQRLGAEVQGGHHATDGPERRTGRVERAREHLPPDPAALHPWFPEELREEVRLPAQDCDRVANDPPSDDGDVEAIRVRRERVTEEPDEVAVAQVSERGEAQAGAGGEIARARGADAGLEARLGHRAGWSTEY